MDTETTTASAPVTGIVHPIDIDSYPHPVDDFSTDPFKHTAVVIANRAKALSNKTDESNHLTQAEYNEIFQYNIELSRDPSSTGMVELYTKASEVAAAKGRISSILLKSMAIAYKWESLNQEVQDLYDMAMGFGVVQPSIQILKSDKLRTAEVERRYGYLVKLKNTIKLTQTEAKNVEKLCRQKLLELDSTDRIIGTQLEVCKVLLKINQLP